MKKQKLKVFAMTALILLLCACQSSRSLGERAIVKAIYLDTADDGLTQAALVVFTCSPNSDTAAAEGEAKIYSAAGRGIEEALRLAERQQNKKPFYAQNELLLLGPNAAAEDVTPYLTYFGQEDSARPNLGVFVTPLTAQGLGECEAVISDVIREGERLLDSQGAEGSPARSIYEIEPDEGGTGGWLPVLLFSKEENSFIGVQSLLLFSGGQAYGVLQENDLQLALLLAGKRDTLSLHEAVNGKQLSCETQTLRVEKTAAIRHGMPVLRVALHGRIQQISADGTVLKGEEARTAATELNGWIEQRLRILNQATFRRRNDVFRWGWWLRMCDAAAAGAMEETGDMYKANCVSFKSTLYIDR